MLAFRHAFRKGIISLDNSFLSFCFGIRKEIVATIDLFQS